MVNFSAMFDKADDALSQLRGEMLRGGEMMARTAAGLGARLNPKALIGARLDPKAFDRIGAEASMLARQLGRRIDLPEIRINLPEMGSIAAAATVREFAAAVEKRDADHWKRIEDLCASMVPRDLTSMW